MKFQLIFLCLFFIERAQAQNNNSRILRHTSLHDDNSKILFTLAAPKKINYNETLSVAVNLIHPNTPVPFIITIDCPISLLKPREVSTTLQPNTTQLINLNITDYPCNVSRTLTATAIHSVGNVSHVKTKKTSLKIHSRGPEFNYYVKTEKPLYFPGETINYNVYLLDDTMHVPPLPSPPHEIQANYWQDK